jgi:hypothetical protein
MPSHCRRPQSTCVSPCIPSGPSTNLRLSSLLTTLTIRPGPDHPAVHGRPPCTPLAGQPVPLQQPGSSGTGHVGRFARSVGHGPIQRRPESSRDSEWPPRTWFRGLIHHHAPPPGRAGRMSDAAVQHAQRCLAPCPRYPSSVQSASASSAFHIQRETVVSLLNHIGSSLGVECFLE